MVAPRLRSPTTSTRSENGPGPPYVPQVSVATVPLVTDTLLLAGLIESSLWYAELSGQVERLGEGE